MAWVGDGIGLPGEKRTSISMVFAILAYSSFGGVWIAEPLPEDRYQVLDILYRDKHRHIDIKFYPVVISRFSIPAYDCDVRDLFRCRMCI